MSQDSELSRHVNVARESFRANFPIDAERLKTFVADLRKKGVDNNRIAQVEKLFDDVQGILCALNSYEEARDSLDELYASILSLASTHEHRSNLESVKLVLDSNMGNLQTPDISRTFAENPAVLREIMKGVTNLLQIEREIEASAAKTQSTDAGVAEKITNAQESFRAKFPTEANILTASLNYYERNVGDKQIVAQVKKLFNDIQGILVGLSSYEEAHDSLENLFSSINQKPMTTHQRTQLYGGKYILDQSLSNLLSPNIAHSFAGDSGVFQKIVYGISYLVMIEEEIENSATATQSTETVSTDLDESIDNQEEN